IGPTAFANRRAATTPPGGAVLDSVCHGHVLDQPRSPGGWCAHPPPRSGPTARVALAHRRQRASSKTVPRSPTGLTTSWADDAKVTSARDRDLAEVSRPPIGLTTSTRKGGPVTPVAEPALDRPGLGHPLD